MASAAATGGANSSTTPMTTLSRRRSRPTGATAATVIASAPEMWKVGAIALSQPVTTGAGIRPMPTATQPASGQEIAMPLATMSVRIARGDRSKSVRSRRCARSSVSPVKNTSSHGRPAARRRRRNCRVATSSSSE